MVLFFLIIQDLPHRHGKVVDCHRLLNEFPDTDGFDRIFCYAFAESGTNDNGNVGSDL